jgi:hypothetical protein
VGLRGPGRAAPTVLLVLALVGCKRGARQEPSPAASASASLEAPLPVDTVLPGELGEGTEKAYGLVLPRNYVIVRRFEGAIFAEGSARAEQAANYVRRRIVASSVEVGASQTIFQGARAKGNGDAPFVRIEVAETNQGSKIVLRDLTPAPVVPGLSDEERWRRAGLKPNGEVLDPQHAF